MKPKTMSFIGMVVGSICLLAVFISFLVKLFLIKDFDLTLEKTGCMILLGVAPSVPFSPIFISVWFDKILLLKGIKKDE